MTAGVVLLAAMAAVVGNDDRPPLIEFGGNPARGVLVILSLGARPGDPPAAGRPTIVFIHGFNPLPGVVHFAIAEQLAQALIRRAGPAFNILAWDWNAATCVSL